MKSQTKVETNVILRRWKNGEVIEQIEGSNTITNWTRALIASFLCGQPFTINSGTEYSLPQYISLGTGNGTPSVTDQTMFQEIYGMRQINTYIDVAQGYTAETVVNYTENPTNETYTEAGLWDQPVTELNLSAQASSGAQTLQLTGNVPQMWQNQQLYISLTTPVAVPSTAPTLTAVTPSNLTSLAAGTYTVGYTFTNSEGETTISPPRTVTLTAGQAIQVSSITPPTSVTGVNYYMSQVGETTLTLDTSGSGVQTDLTALPATGAASPPTVNTSSYSTSEYASVASSYAAGATSWSLQSPLKNTYPLGIANPTTAATLTATAASTSLAAGVYSFAYTFTNANGETLQSPTQSITLTAGQEIQVGAITLPTGATGINYYLSQPGATTLTLDSSGTGAAINLTAESSTGAASPPTINTTGAVITALSGNLLAHVIFAGSGITFGTGENLTAQWDILVQAG